MVGTIDFNDAVDAAAVAQTLQANGVVDVDPYRSSAETSSELPCFRGGTRQRRCPDRLHRLGRGAPLRGLVSAGAWTYR